MTRIVLDTNVLVAAAYQPNSSSGRLVSACADRRLTLVASRAILAEYEYILPRAIRNENLESLLTVVQQADICDPGETPQVVEGDPQDDMLPAAACSGGASLLVTSDRQVLQVGSYQGIQILRPAEAVGWLASQGINLATPS